jgi:hypothetical protein
VEIWISITFMAPLHPNSLRLRGHQGYHRLKTHQTGGRSGMNMELRIGDRRGAELQSTKGRFWQILMG